MSPDRHSEREEQTETRGMAEQGQRARDPVNVSNRTFVVCLVIVVVVFGGLALYLRYAH